LKRIKNPIIKMKEYLFFQNHKKYLPKEMGPGGATPNSDASSKTDPM
jgi:hypothetical protein